jgi:hypothetical protein
MALGEVAAHRLGPGLAQPVVKLRVSVSGGEPFDFKQKPVSVFDLRGELIELCRFFGQ